MQKINTAEVMLRTAKATGNKYFRIGSDIVVVDSGVAAKWDEIDTVTVTRVEYQQRTNEKGELVNEPWSRLEVTGLENTTAVLRKKTNRLEAATAYAKAKNASLKIEDLEPSVKKELEALLA